MVTRVVTRSRAREHRGQQTRARNSMMVLTAVVAGRGAGWLAGTAAKAIKSDNPVQSTWDLRLAISTKISNPI